MKYYLAEWIAGEMTDDEILQYITPEELEQYKEISRIFDATFTPDLDVEVSYKQFLQKRRSNGKVRRLRIFNYVAAAVLAMLISLGVYLNTQVSIHVASGQKRTIALSDGTTVLLNSGATLQYSRNPWVKREVQLEGEAYFEVTKGDRFTVHTAQGEVQVLGTRFNVMSYLNYFEVICYEGKVKVSNGDKVEFLTPGKSVQASPAEQEWNIMEVQDQKADWVNAERNFRSVPLSVVLHTIENQFDYTIDPGVVNTKTKFTGKISYTDLSQAIKNLSTLLQVHYEIDTQNRKIVFRD